MKRILTFLVLLSIAFTAYSQQSLCPATITHEGITYQTIWVGGNCWMKENLRSTQYASQSNIVGLEATYVVYPNTPTAMGYLYTWYSAVGLPEGSTDTPIRAMSDRIQGICPNEWMIPNVVQMQNLFAEGEPRNNEQAYWVYGAVNPPSETNGFNMYPAGYYNAQTDNFYEYKLAGHLWTLTYNGTSASCGIFPFDCRETEITSMNKSNLLSVRCVKSPPYGLEEVTACNSYTWNGNTYTESGTYVGYFPNDSVSKLILTINYTTYGTLDIVACDSYYWELSGKTYTASSTDEVTITNVLGCDSVLTLNLTVNYSNTGTDVQDHCDTYTWIDGITYTETTNEPTFTLNNANAVGCDSTVTLNLTIRNKTYGIDVQNHCDTYTWIDGNTYTETTNEPTFTLTNAAGCDSIVNLNLIIRNKTYGTDEQVHCDTYASMDEITYTESTNEPVYTITNEAGCDSIVTLNLTIKYSTSSPVDTLTEYNTYTWNGETYTESGTYTANLVNAVECDSTATIELTIFNNVTYNLDGGALPAIYPETYVQGVGATLPIPVKASNRFDGWYDNASFTGTPVTVIENAATGDKQYWALWTVLEKAIGSHLLFATTTSPYAYAQVEADVPELKPTTAITLEAWINPTAWQYSAYTGSIITNDNYNNGYQLTCGSNGTLRFSIGTGSSTVEVLSTSGSLTLNEWQHVAGVFDGATMKIYRNGVLLNTKAQTGTIGLGATARLEIGRSKYNTYRYFKGRIDEVRIWNAALDQTNLQTWYNQSLTSDHANYANLVAYYELDNMTDPAVVVGTVGPDALLVSAPYQTGGSCNFTSTSTNIAAPSSVIATHPKTSPVFAAENNAQILKVKIETAIDASLTQITFTTNGTTDVADITNAQLWFTGSQDAYAMITLFGTTVANPNGTFTFTGDLPLNCGTNYFWLTYDVSPTATINNVLDATLESAVVERLEIMPIITAPVGNRKIGDPCTEHTLQIRDTYGDTWQGTFISVLKNSDTIFSNISVTEGPGSDRTLYQGWYDYPFTAASGDTITIIRSNGGSGWTELRVQILRGSGTIVLAETTPVAPPAVITAIAGCYEMITASAGANGTIAPSGSVKAYVNKNQTFAITPNLGYFVDSLIVDGIQIASANSYTFSNVTAPHAIIATFGTNAVTPTLITPPVAGIAYEGMAYSTVPLTGGYVEYNGVAVAGTFTWVTPTAYVPSTTTYTDSVIFKPTLSLNYFPITLNVTGNVVPLSVTVAYAGSTTTNGNIPFYGYYMDAALGQQNFILYPDSMLTPLIGKTISKMTFYTSSPASGIYTSDVTIKLGPTILTSIPTTGAVTYTANTVYTGKVNIVNNQVEVIFTSPYVYSGGNLIFEFTSNKGNYITATFNGVTRTNTSRRSYTTTSTTTNIQSFIPKTKFSYLP